MKKTATLIAAIAAFSLSTPALAQETENRILSLGGGVQARPDYPGADGVGLGPLFYFDIRREGQPLTFEAPDEGIGMGVLGGPLDIGPAFNLQRSRTDKDVGAPVGKVSFTVEAGAFAEYFVLPELRVRVEGRRGIGGHDGWVGDVSADYIVRDHDTYVFSIGPRVRLSDSRYHRAYFGVTPEVAAVTGLPVFDPEGGVHSVGVMAGLTHMIDRNWGLFGHAGYDRLVGDAADSPIVRAFGSRDQFTAGIGIFHSFDIGRPFG